MDGVYIACGGGGIHGGDKLFVLRGYTLRAEGLVLTKRGYTFRVEVLVLARRRVVHKFL